jgi:hypothetical protein
MTETHGDDVESLAPKKEVGIVGQEGTVSEDTAEAGAWTGSE